MTRQEALSTISDLTRLLDDLGETAMASRITEAVQALVSDENASVQRFIGGAHTD